MSVSFTELIASKLDFLQYSGADPGIDERMGTQWGLGEYFAIFVHF